MTTIDVFADLNYPRKIELVRITEGYTDQATGEWVPSSQEIVEIKGHVQDVSVKELNNKKEGIYELGDRKLYVDASIDLKAGDEIRITELDGTVTTWIIKEEEKNYHLLTKLGIGRRCFILRAKEI